MAVSFVATVSNSTGNGNTPTLTLPTSVTMDPGDYVLVAYAVTRTLTMNVASSNSTTAYTQIFPTVSNGNLFFSAWGRVMPDPIETQAICLGTGNAQDVTVAVATVFRGVDQSTPLDVTATSTIGTGTTPDSPSITPVSSNNAYVSCVGSLVSDATVTAPSSFLNQVNINAADTRAATAAMAWLTFVSTSAFNPGSWTNFTSAAWGSGTVALRAASTVVIDWGAVFAGPDTAASLADEMRRVVVQSYR